MMASIIVRKQYGRLLFWHFLTALLVAGQAFFVVVAAAADAPEVAVIVADRLNLRSGPGRRYPVVASLPKGTRAQVIARKGDWVQVSIGPKTGFLLNDTEYLRISSASSGKIVPTAAPAVRNRELSRELNASRKKMTAIEREEADILNSLEKTEKELSHIRKAVSRLSTELAAIEKQIKAEESEYQKIEAGARAAEAYATDRLAALYKLSWLGRLHLLTSAESMADFFSRKRAMETILEQDEAVIRQLVRDKAEMRAIINRTHLQKNEKKSVAQNLATKLDQLKEQQRQRESLLKTIRNKKSLQQAAIVSLEAASRELDRAMAAFKAPPPSSPPSPVKPVSRPSPAESSPTAGKPFSTLKGLLLMPVDGKVTSFFGQYTHQKFNVTNFQSGITIKAEHGDPVRAVHGGKVLFSSWFKGFGNMIIIDHGDHYYTIYAHLEELFKAKGDPVKSGEVIATLGDTGSLEGAGLHFEIRHHGKPVNPLGWIKKG